MNREIECLLMSAAENLRLPGRTREQAEAGFIIAAKLDEVRKVIDDRAKITDLQARLVEAEKTASFLRNEMQLATLMLGRNVDEGEWKVATFKAAVCKARQQLANYRKYLGDILAGGSDAESLGKQLRQWVSRAREAEAKLEASERDAAKWRAVCIDWAEDEENGVYTWQGYTISQWTGEAWGPDGFRHDSGDCMEAKAACLEHFKRHGVS